MSVKKTVIGLGFAIAMLTSGAFGGTPQAFLTIVDTVLYPNVSDPNGALGTRQLTVRMNNPAVHVGGYSVALTISDPSIINFGYISIDTIPPDTVVIWKCTPAPCHWDTVYTCPDSCYNYNSQIYVQGTRSATFDFVDASRLSEIAMQVNGIAQTGSGPVLQPGNGVIFRVPLVIFPISDTVPLSQRQVKIYFDSIYTSVSDSTGNTIWRADTSNTLSLTHGTVTIPYSMKGDCNFDGALTATDAVLESNWIFLGSPSPLPSPTVADVNCDGFYTSADLVLELNRIFLGNLFPC